MVKSKPYVLYRIFTSHGTVHAMNMKVAPSYVAKSGDSNGA